MAFFQAKTLWVSHVADAVAELVLDHPDAEVNVIDAQVLADLEQALAGIEKEERFALLVLRSAKPDSFCHGLALDYLASLTSADDFVALARRGQALGARLAQLPMPSVALISGHCFGAGLELALACDYRAVLDRAGLQMGLPQRDLGLLPAWGATQRLPRLIGIERTLQMLLGDRRLGSGEALEWGLADALVSDNDPQLPAFLAAPHKRDRSRFVRRTWRQRLIESTPLGRRLLLRGAARVLGRRLPQDMPAPAEALQAVRLAALRPASDAGFQHECQALGRLGMSAAFRHLLWFQRQRERQRQALARLAAADHPQRLGLLGSGATSLDLLYRAVTHGQEAVLRGANEEKLGIALLVLFKRLEAEARRGVLASPELRRCLSAIRGTFTWTHFDTVDLVLDVSASDEPPIVGEAAAKAPAGTLLACVRDVDHLEEVQKGLPDPSRVVGLRFVQPVGESSVVEIVRTAATAPDGERRLVSWAASLGLTPVPVSASPGGLMLRILMPAWCEAAELVRQGMTLPTIDAAMRRFGFAQGPLEYADMLGIDIVCRATEAMVERCTAGPLLQQTLVSMCERGWRGTRVGVGFYRYRAGRRHANADVEQLLRAGGAQTALPPLSVSDQTRLVQERVVHVMLLEAARCLEEGLVPDADTLDLAVCLAFWPAHQGGPIRHARAAAPGELAATFERLRRDVGWRYELSANAAAVLGI